MKSLLWLLGLSVIVLSILWAVGPCDHDLGRAVDGLRRFDHPTLLLWGRNDTNFGPAIAERLAHDIPGVVRIEWPTNSAHLPMLEEPEHCASAIERFLSNPSRTSATANITRTAGHEQ